METTAETITQCEERVAHNALERQQLHCVTSLAAEIKRLLVRHNDALKEGGLRRELKKLEDWLDAERSGPAPAGIISEGGILWLISLRDKLKLSADEAIRLEGEGGPPASREQSEKNEEVIKAVRRIDQIISDNSSKPKPH